MHKSSIATSWYTEPEAVVEVKIHYTNFKSSDIYLSLFFTSYSGWDTTVQFRVIGAFKETLEIPLLHVLKKIFKKESKVELGNYRPVPVTCIPSKLLESIIRDHHSVKVIKRQGCTFILTTQFYKRQIGWLVTFRLRFDSHCQSFASKLEQVANLLCAQANSASYPPWDGK